MSLVLRDLNDDEINIGRFVNYIKDVNIMKIPN